MLSETHACQGLCGDSVVSKMGQVWGLLFHLSGGRGWPWKDFHRSPYCGAEMSCPGSVSVWVKQGGK